MKLILGLFLTALVGYGAFTLTNNALNKEETETKTETEPESLYNIAVKDCARGIINACYWLLDENDSMLKISTNTYPAYPSWFPKNFTGFKDLTSDERRKLIRLKNFCSTYIFGCIKGLYPIFPDECRVFIPKENRVKGSLTQCKKAKQYKA